ncbi:autophagy-related protein 18f-like [Raphanus sativus]|uniref:Autophagy-related protein 18f-like n=1 Tax=Raphanus sativus TaxID=3726 RepID=A0A6J0MP01_RAPSA|nr:autophagy-related protein 18f-like [Raphanus sativus]
MIEETTIDLPSDSSILTERERSFAVEETHGEGDNPISDELEELLIFTLICGFIHICVVVCVQVVIKDIISKSVVTQFKAHKSPISALSFDPSGMLLVTASIQGHNINVFRILPRASTSTSSDASFVHLFRLQRGFTNAVIQYISFSNDSSLIAISSSRGTSHLFEINPEGEGNNAPVLSAVNRIRSGNISGWMGTMSGAAAAAAGMVGGSLPGATASAFCYSVEQNKNNNHYGSSAATSDDNLKRNLLVFAPSGCMTQYALKPNQVEGGGHEMAGFDFESGSETEGKVGVEPMRRWSMIQNQSRREMQDQHSDVYGGGGASSDSKSRVFPEIVRKQSAEESWKVTKKGKARGEDKHQMYMSEAELQMYQPSQLPLWGRRNFRFQEWVLDVDEESNGGGGEMDIEGIQTRTIEGRTRGLVPVWGYLQSPKPQQVTGESFQSPRNTTQGDQVAPLECHGTETEFGVVHGKDENLRSEEESVMSEESSPISEEET